MDLFVPDLAPMGMTEDTDDDDDKANDCGDFPMLSVRLLTEDLGDQPLCLFFGGAAFAWGPFRKKHNFIVDIR